MFRWNAVKQTTEKYRRAQEAKIAIIARVKLGWGGESAERAMRQHFDRMSLESRTTVLLRRRGDLSPPSPFVHPFPDDTFRRAGREKFPARGVMLAGVNNINLEADDFLLLPLRFSTWR